jgi:hypothetical protein
MAQFQPLSKPVFFGLLAPTGIGDTHALRLTSNLPANAFGNPNSQDDLQLNKLEIKANANNTGRIFVCWGVAPFNEGSTFIQTPGGPITGGVIRAIDPGEAWAIGDSQKANVYWAGQFQIVIESAGDSCHADGDVL